jgi:hypothetical protein
MQPKAASLPPKGKPAHMKPRLFPGPTPRPTPAQHNARAEKQRADAKADADDWFARRFPGGVKAARAGVRVKTGIREATSAKGPEDDA